MEERTHETVATQVAGLPTLDIQTLKQRWRDCFGTDPPKFNRRQLEQRLAYGLQKQAFGGLSDRALDRMDAILRQGGHGGGSRLARSIPKASLLPGTRLSRSWQGEVHHVLVTKEGFEHRGQPYRSLSGVAKAITGTSWNGYVFFGLKKPRGGKRHE